MKSKEIFPYFRRNYIKGKSKVDRYEDAKLLTILNALEVCENDLDEAIKLLEESRNELSDNINLIIKIENFLQTKK